MIPKAQRYRKMGRVTIGKGCLIDDDVIIGYPPKDTLMKTGFSHSLVTKIGQKCVLRSGVIIYATATLGSDVSFGHHVVVRERVRIGEGSRIGSFVELAPSVKVGKSCRIMGSSFIPNSVKIGDHVFIATGFLAANRAFSRAFLDGQENSEAMEPPEVEDHVLIGCNVVLSPGVKIGRNSVLAPGSVVTKDVAAGSIVAGIPARVIGSTADKFGRGRS